jgi:hypothetical protein
LTPELTDDDKAILAELLREAIERARNGGRIDLTYAGPAMAKLAANGKKRMDFKMGKLPPVYS